MSVPPSPSSRVHRLSVLLLAAFAALFVGIVITANQGGQDRFWPFLRRIPLGDKLGHFGLLAVFSCLLNVALCGRRAPGRLSCMMLGSVVLAIAMTAEELSQLGITTRTFDPWDWIASLAGIFAGECAVRWTTARAQLATKRLRQTVGP